MAFQRLLHGSEEVAEDQYRAEGEDVQAIHGHKMQEMEMLVREEVVDEEEGAQIAVGWVLMGTGSPPRRPLGMQAPLRN